MTAYSTEVLAGNASVFIGAGISAKAGYPDWSTLLEPVFQDLQIDPVDEADLARVAQYYIAAKGEQRTKLTQIIVDTLSAVKAAPQALQRLCQIPIRSFWTTNYDVLLEEAFRSLNRSVDIKADPADFTTNNRRAQTTLYLMHGSVRSAAKVVISSSDYDSYPLSHRQFMVALEAELMSRTFLFLGFSMSDPNFRTTLGRIKAFDHHSPRTHYAVMRAPQRGTSSKKEFDRKMSLFQHRCRDLGRYGIHVCQTQDFSETDEIAEALFAAYISRNVFVAGGISESDAALTQRASDIAREVGVLLADAGLNLVSGYGLTVGPVVIASFIETMVDKGDFDFNSRLVLRPFPRSENLQDPKKGKALYTKYRQAMLAVCGTAIVISGLKDGTVSAGVLEEVKIMRAWGRPVIPIGSTGGAATEVWAELLKDLASAYPVGVSQATFKRLNAPARAPAAVAQEIGKLLTRLGSVR